MPSVDPLFAQWLQSDGLWLVSEDAVLCRRWGETGLTTERMTSIATKADAEAEAARQLAFLGPVAAIDEHLLIGDAADQAGDVAWALTCLEKMLRDDETPCLMFEAELKSMIKVIRKQAVEVCDTLGSFMER